MSIYDLIAQGGPTPPNYAQSAQQGFQLGQQFKQAFDEGKVRSVLNQPGAIDASGNPTQDSLAKIMQINPEYGQKFAAGQQSQDINQLNAYKLRTDLSSQLLGGVKDQSTYDQAKNIAMQHGLIKQGELPDQYDPNLIDSLYKERLSESDKINNMYKMAMAQKALSEMNAPSKQEVYGQPYVGKDKDGNPFYFVMGKGGASDLAGNPIPPSIMGGIRNISPTQYDPSVVLGKATNQALGANAPEAANQSLNTELLLDKFKKAKEIVTEQTDKGKGLESQIAGTFPGMANLLGSDQAAANNFLSGLKVDEQLLNTARTKGAISDVEMALFAEPIPPINANRSVWKKYIEDRMPVIEKINKFQSGLSQGAATPAQTDNAQPEVNNNSLSQYEGKIINQDGKRYKITNGQPVEVQ